MIRFCLALSLLLVPVSAFAQPPTAGPIDARNLGSVPYAGAGNSTSRSLSSRSSDTFNAKDYGSLGNNVGTTLLTTFGATATASLGALAGTALNGGTPFSWMTNPVFGLTFSIPTTVIQSSANPTLTFLETGMSGFSGWSGGSIATWQDPLNNNAMVATGMQVTGTCISAGTTVSAVGRVPGVGGYGTITLNQSTASICASGTSITFTVSPTQLQALTVDWLGIQTAIYQAWSIPTGGGGSAFIPNGAYVLNHTVVVPPSLTPPYAAIDITGGGPVESILAWPTDLGTDFCGILGAGRGGAATSATTFSNFNMSGPTNAVALGSFPAAMDGLCMGSKNKAEKIRVGGFRAGINGLEDHWGVRDSDITNNGYGVYWGPYNNNMGNQYFEDSGIGGNKVASFAIAATTSVDASVFSNVHTGFNPYGFLFEPNTSNVTTRVNNAISNSVFNNVWIEQCGGSWMYDAAQIAQLVNNVFIGGASADVNAASYAFAGQTTPAVIYMGGFSNNTLINTSWAPYSLVTDGIIETTGPIINNLFIGDTGFVTGGTSTKGAIVSTLNGINNNRFVLPYGDGMFTRADATYAAGAVMGMAPNLQATAFTPGLPFMGISASAGSANKAIAIYKRFEQQQITKGLSTQALSAGQPLFATTGGVVGGMDNAGAIGAANQSSGSGTTTVYMDLDPGMSNGALGVGAALSGAGTTQGNAQPLAATTNRFTTVGSGSGALLALTPIGHPVVVYNDGANALLVYPQSGGTINALSTNVGFSIASGGQATFRMISATAWHT